MVVVVSPERSSPLFLRRAGTLLGDSGRLYHQETGMQHDSLIGSFPQTSRRGLPPEGDGFADIMQGCPYSIVDRLEEDLPTQQALQSLQNRLENLVSQMLLCQGRAKVYTPPMTIMITIDEDIEYCNPSLPYY